MRYLYKIDSLKYIFCHHQKGGDCKNKNGSAGISLCFDDNKDFNYMINFDVLMVAAECFKQILILKQKSLHQKLHAQAKDYLKRFSRPVSVKKIINVSMF